MSLSTVKKCIFISAPKSCDLNPIPSSVRIECLNFILPSLTDLFNSTLASSHNASSQLLSHLFSKKCLDRNYLNNYQPIYDLCFIANILEKLVLSQAFSYLYLHNLYNSSVSILSRLQHLTALLKVVNGLILPLNKGNMYVLDFSSAFDTIDHCNLLHRLNTDFGFTHAVFQWSSSYLIDRPQNVSLSNHCSVFAPVHPCVPQGTVLGPILFPCILSFWLALMIHAIHLLTAYNYRSAPPDKILELLRSMQSCISDVKVLATANMYLMLLTALFNAV